MLEPIQNFLKRAAILLLTPFIITCSTSYSYKVHIFSKSIDNERIEYLRDLITSEGHDVFLSKLPVPPEFRRSSIVFPAIIQDMTIVDQLKEVIEIADMGNIDLVYVTQGNHWFKSNNIGVYLVNTE